VFKQTRPIATKGGVVEARFVPVQIQKPAEQKIVIELLALVGTSTSIVARTTIWSGVLSLAATPM